MIKKIMFYSLGSSERTLHVINDNNLSRPWIDVFSPEQLVLY